MNGENVGAISSYQIENITENQYVEAFFAPNIYEISVQVHFDDEVLYFDTLRNVICGSDTSVEIPLFDCYFVDSTVVNGENVGATSSLLIENVREDGEVVFYLSREHFYIVATSQGNGTVTPMDTVLVACDDLMTFTFTPDEGWYVQNLVVDGESLGTPSENYYTFANINANHTIEVIFASNVYIITSSIDPIDAGNISPYGQAFVNHGEDQTFNIMPFPGYEVIDVEVDGMSVGAVTSYTFYAVTENHTIVAHLMTVGVDEATMNEGIAVWPNPVENVCHIQLPDMRNVELQLFDGQGKLVFRKHADADEVEIDFAGKPSGMYMLRIVSNGKVVDTKKIIRK